jgi:hypothetical protein
MHVTVGARERKCVWGFSTKATPPGAGSFLPTPMPGVISNPFTCAHVIASHALAAHIH